MPRITVGLPVYNGEKYLAEAIEALLDQTFRDFELIISDNGSTDSTPEICRMYAKKDSRIKLFLHRENAGAAWNYNFIFSQAGAEYFRWASHDDLIAPAFLEKTVEVLDACPDVVLCYPQTMVIDAVGHNIGRYVDGLHLDANHPLLRFEKFLFRKGRKCNAVFGLIRRSVLAKTDLIGNYNASDQVLLAHLALLGKFYEVPEMLFFRRDHPGTSINANKTAKSVAEWFDTRKQKKFVFPTLRLAFEYFKCIFSVNMKLIEKLTCWKYVLKSTWWARQQIRTEVVNAIRGV